MAFDSSISWQYKDLVTSAKLAAMVENTRVHDHFGTDQGARLGVMGIAAKSTPKQTVSGTSEVNIDGSAVAFTIPSGAPGGRVILSLCMINVTLEAANYVSLTTKSGTFELHGNDGRGGRFGQGNANPHESAPIIRYATVNELGGPGAAITLQPKATFSAAYANNGINAVYHLAFLL